MCSVELETCECWVESQVNARKAHVCNCCRGPIIPGQTYVKHFSVYDGEPSGEKQCLPCYGVSRAFGAEHGVRGIPSAMEELLVDCVGEEGPDEAAAWVAALADMKLRADSEMI